PAVHHRQQPRHPDPGRAWPYLLRGTRALLRPGDPAGDAAPGALAAGGAGMISGLSDPAAPGPGGNDLPGLHRVPIWFNDPLNWKGPDGLLAYASEHIVYAIVVLAAALAIAVPLGLLVGHTGRGSAIIGGTANALRAVPPLGLLILLIAVI